MAEPLLPDTFLANNIDNDYTANEEDLKYFKETFENILLKKDFLNIFKLSEMKKFILEVI